MEYLELGNPQRVVGFSQRVPTLRHPYGEVPIVFESAGIKRMVARAYLIVWAWTEHKRVAAELNRPLQESSCCWLTNWRLIYIPSGNEQFYPLCWACSVILVQILIAKFSSLRTSHW